MSLTERWQAIRLREASRQELLTGRGRGSLAIRVPLAALLYVVVASWVARHLGWTFSSVPLVSIALAAISVSTNLFKLFGDTTLGGWPRRRHQILEFVIGVRPLTILGIVFLLVSSTVSSITVVGSGGDAGRKAGIGPGEVREPARMKSLSSLGSVRFVRLTWPFGTTCTLWVDGYNPMLLVLYPFFGRTLRLDKDLTPSPAVFVRAPPEVRGEMVDSHFDVLVRIGSDSAAGRQSSPGETTNLRIPTSIDTATVLLGRAARISESQAADWREELLATPSYNATVIAQTMRSWRHVAHPAEPVPLVPGQLLAIRLVSRSGALLAAGTHRVGTEAIQDVRLDAE